MSLINVNVRNKYYTYYNHIVNKFIIEPRYILMRSKNIQNKYLLILSILTTVIQQSKIIIKYDTLLLYKMLFHKKNLLYKICIYSRLRLEYKNRNIKFKIFLDPVFLIIIFYSFNHQALLIFVITYWLVSQHQI